MAYNMILTSEQEQRRKESKQALKSLKYNEMCYSCKSFCSGCEGTRNKVYSGCIRTEKADGFPSIYTLATYIPELVKNNDWFSFDEFLEDLRNEPAEVIKYLRDCIQGEKVTGTYINACEKILEALGEDVPERNIAKIRESREKVHAWYLEQEKYMKVAREELSDLGF